MQKYKGEYNKQEFLFDGTEQDFIHQCCLLGAEPRRFDHFADIKTTYGGNDHFRIYYSDWFKTFRVSAAVSSLPFEECAERAISKGHWVER